MARTEMTNRDFHFILRDLQNIQQTSPAISFLLKEKINRFYQQNAMSIKILNKFIKENVAEHVEHDQEGKPLTIEKDGVQHYRFADEDQERMYTEKANEFMSRSIYVEG